MCHSSKPCSFGPRVQGSSTGRPLCAKTTLSSTIYTRLHAWPNAGPCAVHAVTNSVILLLFSTHAEQVLWHFPCGNKEILIEMSNSLDLQNKSLRLQTLVCDIFSAVFIWKWTMQRHAKISNTTLRSRFIAIPKNLYCICPFSQCLVPPASARPNGWHWNYP